MAGSSIGTLTLDVSTILMDKENPRHDILKDQSEILNWHVTYLGDKLIQLMRSIAKHGLSDIDRILLYPSGDGHVVKEGNRRIAALKLMQNPALCEDSLFRRKIESVSVDRNFSFSIECTTCSDLPRILWMMGLKHLGQQNGVGTSSWGAAEKNRHNQDYTGEARYWRSVYFIDYGLENRLVTEQQAIRIYDKISNLDRLVPSAEFKNALGVAYKNSSVIGSLAKPLFDKILGSILEKFSDPNFNVSRIYTSEDRAGFITEVLDGLRSSAQHSSANPPSDDDSLRKENLKALILPLRRMRAQQVII